MEERVLKINNFQNFITKNNLLYKFFFMENITPSDFVVYDNIKSDPFFHYIDFLSTLCAINPGCSSEKYIEYLDKTISSLSEATGYCFESESEKKLFIYSLLISTYEDVPFTSAKKPSDQEIIDMLNVDTNSTVRVYCSYIFCNGIVSAIEKDRYKNGSLFISLVSKLVSLQEEYDNIVKCVSLLKNNEEEK